MNEDAGDELTLLRKYRATGHYDSTEVRLRINKAQMLKLDLENLLPNSSVVVLIED